MSLAVDLCVAKCHSTKCLTLYGIVFGVLLQLFIVKTTLMLVCLLTSAFDFRVYFHLQCARSVRCHTKSG